MAQTHTEGLPQRAGSNSESIYLSISIYLYLSNSIYISLSLSLYIYIYIYSCDSPTSMAQTHTEGSPQRAGSKSESVPSDAARLGRGTPAEAEDCAQKRVNIYIYIWGHVVVITAVAHNRLYLPCISRSVSFVQVLVALHLG